MVSRPFTRWRGRREESGGSRRDPEKEMKVRKETERGLEGEASKKEKKKKKESGQVAVFFFLFFLWEIGGGSGAKRRRWT